MVDEEKKHERERPEDVKEILKVVSEEVPGLIKNLLSTVLERTWVKLQQRTTRN